MNVKKAVSGGGPIAVSHDRVSKNKNHRGSLRRYYAMTSCRVVPSWHAVPCPPCRGMVIVMSL